MTFCVCKPTAFLAVPSLKKTVGIMPISENGQCHACGLSRHCSFCNGPLADAAHNTMEMHIEGASGGTGCPVVREPPPEAA